MRDKRTELLNGETPRLFDTLGRAFHRHQNDGVDLHRFGLLPHCEIPERAKNPANVSAGFRRTFPNAFTSAFKELDPLPQFKATAKLGEFLEARFSQRF